MTAVLMIVAWVSGWRAQRPRRLYRECFGIIALLLLAVGAEAITVNGGIAVSGSQNAAGTTGAFCSDTEITYNLDVTGVTNDVADGLFNPQGDRFIVRLIDANNDIIASNGFVIPVGTTLNSGVSIRVGDRARSVDALVAPTLRPFRMQIFESTTPTNTDRFTASGPALFTSSAFDPAGGGAFAATGCSGVPGGAVTDTTPPVINVPANITVNTDPGQPTAVVTYSVTATDNIGVTAGPTRTAGPASGAAFPVGTTTVTHTASDAAGNTAQADFVVTVVDNEPPVFITVPADISVNTDPGQSTAVVNFNAFADDNAGAVSFTIISSPTAGLGPGSAFPIGVTTIIISAIDDAGNTANHSFTITVDDGEAPAFTSSQAPITVDTDPGLNTAIVTYPTPTAVDNSGTATVTRTAGPASGSAFPLGATTVTHQASDGAGNTTDQSFTVTVTDGELPVFTSSQAPITVNTDPGQTTAVVSYPTPTATDNAGPAMVTRIAGPASGSAFPLGTTTVTHRATDGAGNTADQSFTVTVMDAEVPVFTSTQADINVDIDFNQTSAVVDYPTPTATDNGESVTVTRIAGPASGSAFPVGTTTVTHRATDGSGNTADQSFTVTIAVVSPGTVEFIINSPADTVISFTSGTPAFNVDVAVTGGTGSSGALQVVPGTYAASFTVAGGFGVTGGNCSNPAGAVDTRAQTLGLTFAPGESYVCTVTLVDSVETTSDMIQSFIDARGRLIIANQPDAARRIGRFTGQAGDAGVTMFGQRLPFDTPLSVNVGQDLTKLGFSTSSFDGPDALWDFWTEATVARFDQDTSDGDFFILHFGFDKRISDNTLMGLAAQIDRTEQMDTAGPSSIEGTGWMIGPYYTRRMAERLFFDASLKWGRADNTISPLGTFSDSFDSTRFLATAALIGDRDFGMLNVQPEFRLTYFTETTDAYVDGVNVTIPEQETRQGEAEVKARFSTDMAVKSGQMFAPYFGIDGIWTFESTSAAGAAPSIEEGLRGRINTGFSLTNHNSSVLEFGVSYDGLGDDSYESVALSLGFNISF
ncbi:HYR domain-containing protein [Aaestuariibius violaceus]|uniref:HYR domain-containing protein n=1 Tax=Aestuariibius violaceus TaxID=3234132 RepID=UPI00346C1402